MDGTLHCEWDCTWSDGTLHCEWNCTWSDGTLHCEWDCTWSDGTLHCEWHCTCSESQNTDLFPYKPLTIHSLQPNCSFTLTHKSVYSLYSSGYGEVPAVACTEHGTDSSIQYILCTATVLNANCCTKFIYNPNIFCPQVLAIFVQPDVLLLCAVCMSMCLVTVCRYGDCDCDWAWNIWIIKITLKFLKPTVSVLWAHTHFYNPYGPQYRHCLNSRNNQHYAPLHHWVAYTAPTNPLKMASICRNMFCCLFSHSTYSWRSQHHIPVT
jgi:hypothetical protein